MIISNMLTEKLKRLAALECWNDALQDEDQNCCVVDFSGDNVDDAFWGGYRSGETNLAREILKELERE